ncbi:hypothetical protein [Pseudoalteromonas sp. 31A1]|uniref:hypothetical protein n=1 Tax=Pseudoalteromonas sp. 31A1 TaxID=2686351 RepID=UPI0013FDA927|nr:hypothetical protein [Pseudoalteromonas sp. 31A1]
MLITRLTLCLALCSPASFATIGNGHVTGEITNVTSIRTGLLVMVGNSEVPLTCKSGQSWMHVKQENTAMISMLMTAWTLKRKITVYTDPGNTGFCQVNQIDPHER